MKISPIHLNRCTGSIARRSLLALAGLLGSLAAGCSGAEGPAAATPELLAAPPAEGPPGTSAGPAPHRPLSLLSSSYFTAQQLLTPAGATGSIYFGSNVAISGDTAVVGAYYDDLAGAKDAGAAYVYTRSGTTWTQQQKLTASDATAGDIFGSAVAIDGDTIVVGAEWAHNGGISEAGAAYVFTRSGTTWTQQQKLTPSDPGELDVFGAHLALSGDTVVITSYYADLVGAKDAGAAYVFTRSGTTWTQQQKLTASDPVAGATFGWSTAIDGDTVVVGAPQAAAGTGAKGAAYVYTRSGTTWTQQQKLIAADAATNADVGMSIALSGNTVVTGTTAGVNPAGVMTGAAYVFTRSGTTWTQQQKLLSSDGAANDYFGIAVAVSGDTALLCASGLDLGTVADVGGAYVFTRSGTTWTQLQKLTDTTATRAEYIGNSAALSNNTALVGIEHNNATQVYAAVPTKVNGSACTTTAECASGYCVDGLCCDGACGGGIDSDCQACSAAKGAAKDGTCGPIKAGSTCRAAAGVCDRAETCDGTNLNCPADAFLPTTTVCRPVNGACDVAENCTGTAAACPLDLVQPSTVICRPAAGPCDYTEYCTGIPILGKDCPADFVKDPTTVCRPVAGDCDVAENCNGTSTDCPPDSFLPSTKECRASAGPCDVAEHCAGAAACPPDSFLPSTKECRASVGPCDAAETCTGTAAACPADRLRGSTEVCRPAIGDCDAPEFCSGTSTSCPPDAVAPSTTVCRPSIGACDVAEYCTGSSVVCPPDSRGPTCDVSADLAVTLSATPAAVGIGGAVQLLVAVRNAGNSTAAPVQLVLDLPPAVMFQSSSGGDWDCQPTQGALTCSLKQLGVTTAPPLTLSLLVSTAGSFTLAATVSSPVADPVPGNNSATATLTGGGAATGCACSVGGGGSPGSAAPGLGLLLVALLAARRRRAGRLVPAT